MYVGPPPGTLFCFAATTAPNGYLLCDGSSLLRASFPDLFAAIGTTYGAVDGTHFTLPDGRGRTMVGVGTHTDVAALGASDGLAVGSRRPKHLHTVVQPAISIAVNPTITVSNAASSVTATVVQGNVAGTPVNSLLASNNPQGSFNVDVVNGQHSHPASASGGSYTASSGTVGPQTLAPTDTPAHLVINWIIKV